MLLTYKENYKLRESDFNGNDKLRVSSLLDIFQTIAGKHATMLGLGFDAMKERGLAWVIVKLKYDLLLPVKAGDVLTVETRPQPKRLVDYTRDFFVTNERSELVAKAGSTWVLIDFESRKINKDGVDFDGEFSEEHAYENRRIEHVAPLSEPSVYSHTVTRSEIDHNGHTNNIRYADMCYNAAPVPNADPTRVIINFLTETRLGDRIDVSYAQEDNVFLYTGKRGDEPCFTARMEYPGGSAAK